MKTKANPFNARLLIFGFLLVTTLFISACGTGEGDVGFGDGQGSDPVAVDFPIAYVKRPLPVDDQGNLENPDARELITFSPGADLFIRDRSSSSTGDINITSGITQGLGDVRDVEFSFDGDKVIFSLREPMIEGADEKDQPKWNIWEYIISTKVLHRVIASDITAEAGHDIAPHYLPDDRIVFTSTRQRQSRAILLDESKPQFAAQDEDRNEDAFVLHVMNADGSGIKQISFNQSHDLDPSILSNGQIVFTRWDHAPGNNAMNLYKTNPDGTELELLYGANSHNTGTTTDPVQFLQPRERPDGKVLSILQPFVGTDSGGDVVEIDTSTYVENTQPTAVNQGLTGPAQASATVNDVRTDASPSPGGRYDMVFPLWDGTDRMFVSWSLCRLLEGTDIVPCTPDRLAAPGAVPAPPLYGIWLYNSADNTQLPVVVPEEGVIFTDIAAAQPRVTPPVILDKQAGAELDADLVAEGVGVLNIRSVYDIYGVDTATPSIGSVADPKLTTADQRPARFLRVVKAVSLPDRDVRDFVGTAFGPGGQRMREIVANIPIEPDGSVKVKVPANVALSISVLDKNGRRISSHPRHQNWLQVRPGEERKCTGCHDPASNLSHGRQGAFNTAYAGASGNGVPFPNTDPTLIVNAGETMAETRARLTCVAASTCSMDPSVDVVYDDVWTDEVAAGRLKDVSFAYRYADLETPPPVALTECLTNWKPACRVMINYETHIHPLWNKARQTLDAGGAVIQDNTCTLCHNIVDAAGAVKIPDAQLDLSDGVSDQQADHFKSYRELLFGDNELTIVNGALVDLLVPGVDANGNPAMVPVPVSSPMSAAGANASTAFFSRFDVGGTHQGYLSDAEKRLLSEWIDIGGQYYNNPFDAPEN